MVTLAGVFVVRPKATDQDRRRPVDEAGSASIATAIVMRVSMTATDVGTTTLEIGVIEEDDAIRETETETGVGVGVRLVIGEDTTTTTASTTGGDGNRHLEVVTTAVRTTAGGAGRGVLLLKRDGEATTTIGTQDGATPVTGEGEMTDRPSERGTTSVAGSISLHSEQACFSCKSAHLSLL